MACTIGMPTLVGVCTASTLSAAYRKQIAAQLSTSYTDEETASTSIEAVVGRHPVNVEKCSSNLAGQVAQAPVSAHSNICIMLKLMTG